MSSSQSLKNQPTVGSWERRISRIHSRSLVRLKWSEAQGLGSWHRLWHRSHLVWLHVMCWESHKKNTSDEDHQDKHVVEHSTVPKSYIKTNLVNVVILPRVSDGTCDEAYVHGSGAKFRNTHTHKIKPPLKEPTALIDMGSTYLLAFWLALSIQVE